MKFDEFINQYESFNEFLRSGIMYNPNIIKDNRNAALQFVSNWETASFMLNNMKEIYDSMIEDGQKCLFCDEYFCSGYCHESCEVDYE